jgi:HAD superfamily hydrolase (TIGR01549 family)
MIWDAGGTLFDTYPAVVQAAQAALKDFGETASSDWLMALFRTSTDEALAALAEAFEIRLKDLSSRFSAAYDAMRPELQPPFAHAREICETVCQHGGRNFIVTHRGWSSLKGLLEAHAMTRYFADIITGDDPYPRKPDPTSLRVLLARNGLSGARDRRRCMVIGDRELDILAGRRAGVRTCLFGETSPDVKADLVVEDYSALLRWLRRQYQEAAA